MQTTTALLDFVQGQPSRHDQNPENSSAWRCGENQTVSSLLSSPKLHSYIGHVKPLAIKPTDWRSGDQRRVALGSQQFQQHRDQTQRQDHNTTTTNNNTTTTTNTNSGDWRLGDYGTAPLGSSTLETLIQRHQSQVRNNPRTVSVASKRFSSAQKTLNNTLAIVGSPELQRRITVQRTSPPSPTHLKRSLSSPILPLGSPTLQHRATQLFARNQNSGSTNNRALTQNFSESFVASHHECDQANKMSWNDRNCIVEDTQTTLDYNYYPPRNTSTQIKGRQDWIAGKQLRPPPRHERGSLEWSANATRRARANDRERLLSSTSSYQHDGRSGSFGGGGGGGGESNGSPTTTREKGAWRYKKRYFFHKAGRSMLRQAYM